MKSIEYILNKYSYNDANQYDLPDGASATQSTNSFYQDDPSPFNEYTPPGMFFSRVVRNDGMEGHQRDGNDLEEFRLLKRKNRLKRLKRLMKLRKMKGAKEKKDVFTPAPFYPSAYGYTGFEGAYTSPLEYYSGSVLDEPGAITNNPYNNSWQGNSYASANSRNIRLKIRAMIFKDYIMKG